mmetsp:Transcript_15432/g.46561  ORF Transcript_15432/g.46561 Transcript_15432/m.46561 type:complete len:90 (-) Transcript_15432:1011-1280(-)
MGVVEEAEIWDRHALQGHLGKVFDQGSGQTEQRGKVVYGVSAFASGDVLGLPFFGRSRIVVQPSAAQEKTQKTHLAASHDEPEALVLVF